MSEVRELYEVICKSEAAAKRVFDFLDRGGEKHNGKITGATMAKVLGVHPRTWRKWMGGERKVNPSALKMLRLISKAGTEYERKLVEACQTD